MAGAATEQRVGQLVKVLGELKRLHDELAVVVRNKLEAMRTADTDAIRSATSREEFLARKVREQDGLRKQLLEMIGKAMDVPAAQARSMTVSDLAGRLGEPAKSQLLALGAALRERVQETAEKNRVAAVVSHEMLKHFRQVYEVMAQTNRTTGVYTRAGRADRRESMNVFDAVV